MADPTDSVIADLEAARARVRDHLAGLRRRREAAWVDAIDANGRPRPRVVEELPRRDAEITALVTREAGLDAAIDATREDLPRRERERKAAAKLEREVAALDAEAAKVRAGADRLDREAEAKRAVAGDHLALAARVV